MTLELPSVNQSLRHSKWIHVFSPVCQCLLTLFPISVKWRASWSIMLADLWQSSTVMIEHFIVFLQLSVIVHVKQNGSDILICGVIWVSMHVCVAERAHTLCFWFCVAGCLRFSILLLSSHSSVCLPHVWLKLKKKGPKQIPLSASKSGVRKERNKQHEN